MHLFSHFPNNRIVELTFYEKKNLFWTKLYLDQASPNMVLIREALREEFPIKKMSQIMEKNSKNKTFFNSSFVFQICQIFEYSFRWRAQKWHNLPRKRFTKEAIVVALVVVAVAWTKMDIIIPKFWLEYQCQSTCLSKYRVNRWTVDLSEYYNGHFWIKPYVVVHFKWGTNEWTADIYEWTDRWTERHDVYSWQIYERAGMDSTKKLKARERLLFCSPYFSF